MGNKAYCVKYKSIIVNTDFICKSAPSKDSLYDLEGFSLQDNAEKFINALYLNDPDIHELLKKADVRCPLVKYDMEAFIYDVE
jgi:hypothetical protein